MSGCFFDVCLAGPSEAVAIAKFLVKLMEYYKKYKEKEKKIVHRSEDVIFLVSRQKTEDFSVSLSCCLFVSLSLWGGGD